MNIEQFFAELAKEYKKLNNVQSATAIQSIESIKYDVMDILAKYADKDGTIQRSKNAKIMRELDALFPQFKTDVDETIAAVIEDTASWTTDKLVKYFAVTYGVSLVADSIKNEVKTSIVEQIFGHKWENGLTLNDSAYWLARSIHDTIRVTVNVNSKKGFQSTVNGIENSLKNERWPY